MSIGSSPSFSTIANRIGDSAPHSMSEFYSVQFTDGSRSPSGGTISLSQFRNKTVGNPPPPPPSYVAPPSFSPPSDGGCFSPNTLLRLSNGDMIKMGEITIGDVLEGGISVNAVLQILNKNDIPYYKVYNESLDDYIYVTGSHHVLETDGRFVHVNEYSKSEKTDIVDKMWICLITSNHNIPIGGHTFWDWSDWCDTCEKCTIPQEFFTRENRLNVL